MGGNRGHGNLMASHTFIVAFEFVSARSGKKASAVVVDRKKALRTKQRPGGQADNDGQSSDIGVYVLLFYFLWQGPRSFISCGVRRCASIGYRSTLRRVHLRSHFLQVNPFL